MLLFYSGLFYLIKRFNSLHRNIPILMYHSIECNESGRNIPSCLDLFNMVVNLKCFEKQMAFIAKYYNVISLRYMMECMDKGGEGLPKNSLVITFDDGFKNNFLYAFPILKKQHFPATIFLIGDTIGNSSLIWLHRLYNLIDNLSVGYINTDFDGTITKYKIGKNNKAKVLKKILHHINKIPRDEKLDFINRLEELNSVKGKSENYYLNKIMINEMLADNIDFGAHSMEHSVMTSLDDKKIENEILQSKQLLRDITGMEIIPFAYPHGTIETWDERVIYYLKKHQLLCAMTTIEGLNNPNTNIYEMKRIEIRNFTVYELILHISGLIGFIKRVMKMILGRKYI